MQHYASRAVIDVTEQVTHTMFNTQ